MPSQADIDHQQDLLAIQRGNLAHLIRQAMYYGGEERAPLHVANEIRYVRDNIRRIKGILSEWRVAVENLPDDEPPVVALPAPPQSSVEPSPSGKPRGRSTSRRKPPGDDTTPYDLFISYHPADKGWVRGELLPRLEDAGLKVIVDYRDF